MKYLSLILLFFNSFVHSQNIEVEYTENIIQENYPETITIERKLNISGENSIYNLISSNVEKGKKTKNSSVYKNSKTGIAYSNLSFSSLDMNIQDTLKHLFNWELKNEQKEILGYQCSKAMVHFRGREFEAWYTPAIPVQNGPYKFHGLPGLILEVKTTKEGNDVYKYHAVANTISINDNVDLIINPFEGSQTYSWEEFRLKYEKIYKKLQNYKGADGNSTISISKGGVELFILNED